MVFVIILDVDNTLIHAVKKCKLSEHAIDMSCYIKTANYYVALRPNIIQFIEFCFTTTPYVILWSAGTLEYINEVCKFLISTYSFYKIITRSTYGIIEKNLEFIYTDDIIDKATIIFIDDVPTRITSIRDNVIVFDIKPFNHTEIKSDVELISMQEYLTIITSS
jgi:hypothetical protein